MVRSRNATRNAPLSLRSSRSVVSRGAASGWLTTRTSTRSDPSRNGDSGAEEVEDVETVADEVDQRLRGDQRLPAENGVRTQRRDARRRVGSYAGDRCGPLVGGV